MLDDNGLFWVTFNNGEMKRVPDSVDVVFLKNYYYDDYIKFMWEMMPAVIDTKTIKQKDTRENYAKSLMDGSFFVGPYRLYDILINVVLIIDKNSKHKRRLIGSGYSTTLCWNGTLADLPGGWQDTLRRSYEDKCRHNTPDTFVALGIDVEEAYKECGWSTKIIGYMKKIAVDMSLNTFIAPLMPPQRYQRDYASMPFEDFVYLKRSDGQFQDHWIRAHTKMGARILKCVPKSHRWILSRDEFIEVLQPQSVILDGEEIKQPNKQYFSTSGKCMVLWGGRWYNIYVVVEHDMIVIDQGGVWVEHSLD